MNRNKQFNNNSNSVSSSKTGNNYNVNNVKTENSNDNSTNTLNNKENDVFTNGKKSYLPSPSPISLYNLKKETSEQSTSKCNILILNYIYLIKIC